MKLSAPLFALVAFAQAQVASSAECGHWYSSDCVCDADIRYCKDGENGASDDIMDQHPFWKDYVGYYNFTAHSFSYGLFNREQIPFAPFMFKTFPSYGFMNHTIDGSRSYNHRYRIEEANPDVNCSNPMLDVPFTFVGECGVNGYAYVQEGFGTSAPERDGTVVTTTALQPSAGPPGGSITDENAEYKQVPVDENTLFGSAKSDLFLVTETFSFTNKDKTEAGAVQDVYMFDNDRSILVLSIRMSFTRMPDASSFEKAILDKYNEFNVADGNRAALPVKASCSHGTDCPTEEDFCAIDPRCTESVKYEEPSASVEAGPIVGFVVAAFVVLIGVLYMVHRKMMKDQAERNQAVFARRIAETIKLEGPTRDLTPEALAEEFKKIDNDCVDGTIDKKELWEFINSGKVNKMDEKDFNALFAALDTDGDGTVSFMEFCAYMGKCYDDFDKLKSVDSVKQVRGKMMDNYYTGVSRRILGAETAAPLADVDEEKSSEEDEENV